MKKLVSFFAIGFISIAIISGCVDEKRELIGYKFNKEYAETEAFSSDDLTGSVTVDMYIMLHDYPSSWASIISKFKSDKENEFHLRIKNKDNAQWYYGDGGSAIVLNWKPIDVLPLNEWVRLTAVRDIEKKTMELFVNGESVAKKNFKSLKKASKTNAKVIMVAQGRSKLDATLAEMRIWSKPLSKSNIMKTAGIIKRADKDDAIIGYWLFEKVENGVVWDFSSKSHDVRIKKKK